ncbi:MAG TPA: cysteine desulfurase family protein [Rhizomicrobium sp.]|nr:cysteine desulfurase family protein [Rhizomicrobium sp.]
MHYLDHNATSPLRPESLAPLTQALGIGGNPSSVHARGRAARAVVEEAKEKIALLAGASAHDIIFTSGATEAANLALAGAVEGAIHQHAEGRHAEGGGTRITRLFVSAIEHSAVSAPAQRLAERIPGVRVESLPVTRDGVIDVEALRVALREGKGRALVAVMAANNETGVIQPIAEVSRHCREAGALLLVDAVAAAGKLALDASLCDYMVLSAHKIGGPQGVGALLVAKGAPLTAQIVGGGQQDGLRAGTENLSGIAGFAAAAHAVRNGDGERDRVLHLRDRFESLLLQAIPQVVIFGAESPRLIGTSNFALPGIPSATAMIALDLDGVWVSAGSSCSSGKVAASHVLQAMGVEYALASCALRASFGWNSDVADVDAAIIALTKLWQRKNDLGRAA